MTLRFRNVNDNPTAPVECWGDEALLAAVDRGGISDWAKIFAGVSRDPHGALVDRLEQVLDLAEDTGAAAALRTATRLAVAHQTVLDREAITAELSHLVTASGLDQGAFARRIGTSRTRLNAYLAGRTLPSALVMLRSRRVGQAQTAVTAPVS